MSANEQASPVNKPKLDKNVATILAFFFGWTGVHNMYLGSVRGGCIQAAATLFTCGLAAIVGVLEAVVLLTMKPESFEEKYNQSSPGPYELVIVRAKPLLHEHAINNGMLIRVGFVLLFIILPINLIIQGATSDSNSNDSSPLETFHQARTGAQSNRISVAEFIRDYERMNNLKVISYKEEGGALIAVIETVDSYGDKYRGAVMISQVDGGIKTNVIASTKIE